jgi:hypothetical protein
MDQKMNRYKINPGEIIKIGRITFRIRDIKFADKKNKNRNSNINNTSLNESNNLQYDKEIGLMNTEGISIKNNENIKYNKKNKNIKEDTNEKIINITKKELKKNLNIFSKVEKKNIVCRICYMEEEDDQKDPSVQPCICNGSLKYIHLSCLK